MALSPSRTSKVTLITGQRTKDLLVVWSWVRLGEVEIDLAHVCIRQTDFAEGEEWNQPEPELVSTY